MKRKNGVFRIVMIIIVGVVIGSAVYSWNARSLAGNEMPMPFGFGVSVVLTGSMEPRLSANDLVVIKPAGSYNVGDIVVYQSGRTLIIHRIKLTDGETVVTQGDANNVPDDPIQISDVKGKLVFSVPFIGLIVRGIKTVPGTLIIIALAVFLMIRSRRGEQDKEDAEIKALEAELIKLGQEVKASDQDTQET